MVKILVQDQPDLQGVAMTVYGRFAEIYAQGQYPTLSQAVAEILPSLISRYNITLNEPIHLLDVACGEGSFAVEMARTGWKVTGVDQSEEMLRLAHHRAKQSKLQINFIKQDMRYLDYSNEFDMATCWYDSLNYMITNDDLQSTFNNISRALKPGGWFLFDMNTIYGLAVKWQKQPCYVQQETAELVELHRTSYDFEKRLACIKITWFVKVSEVWEKFEEKHTERAFSIQEIEDCLEYAGLEVIDKLGSLDPIAPVTATSGRAWFLTRKPD